MAISRCRWLVEFGCALMCILRASAAVMKSELVVSAPTKINYGDYEGKIGIIMQITGSSCVVRILKGEGYKDISVRLANLEHPLMMDRVEQKTI